MRERTDPSTAAAARMVGLGLAFALGLATLVGCGSSSPPVERPAEAAEPTQPTAPPAEASTEEPTVAPATPEAASAASPSETECRQLLAHVVGLANDAHAETVEPAYAPTEEQLADIRKRMAPEFIPYCQGLSRDDFDCQHRARNRDELLACVQ
ncbi:hypothetical protein [Haliangium sp.]|uniref:hypothetical protein n=1 Tax=Haliangium sp. TaxID=2663208 RepID=UPI003D14FC83